MPNTNWGRRTGGLGRTSPPDPPDLKRYSTTPRYDMTTIADLIGVRAVTLWNWEQNLGIIVHDAAAEAATGLRYSERDLIVLSWLRDQIVAGVDPIAAAHRLREAIVAAGGTPPPLPSTPRTPSRPLGTAALRQGDPSLNPPSVPYTRPIDPSLNPPSRPIPAGMTGQPLSRNLDPSLNPPSRPIGRGSEPISRLGASRYIPDATQPQSQPLPGGQAISQTWVGAMPSRDLRTLVQPLLQSFSLLDASAAARILDDAFMSRSVETACLTLVAPTLARIQEVWTRKDDLLPEGVFGMNVLKARLFRLFDVLPENANAPLTFVASGPDEVHELNALMLALFWRRMGLRVVYFGLGATTGMGIVASARKQRPRVIGLTVTTAARASLIGKMHNEIAKFDAPRPNFCLVGDVLERDGALRKKMGGIYLGMDAGVATQSVRQLLRATDGRS